MQRGKVNVLIDGQWGSTGKGKLAGILAAKHRPELSVCNFMTNAGHTWVGDDGDTVMVQQLPSLIINRDCMCHIAATAAVDPTILQGELDRFNRFNPLPRLSIDPRATVIRHEHKEEEAKSLHRISSTVKGCGAALSHKIMRHDHDIVGNGDDKWFGMAVRDTEKVVHVGLINRMKILFETAQGFDLSLNHGTRFPYTTSRDVTVAQALNDACVPPSKCGDVYGSLRAHPIRVGNAFEFTGGDPKGTDGWSGPSYPDQRELSWEDVTFLSGAPTPLLERTTVTNKIRRVFSFSELQLERFIMVNNPTFLFINFVNYLDHRAYGVHVFAPEDRRRFFSEFPVIRDFVEKVNEHGVPVAYLGTGPKQSHVVDLGVDLS